MYLISIFLPLDDPEGRPWDGRLLDDVRRNLIDRFGGVTIYSRAPAQGSWKDNQAKVRVDRIIIAEVITETIDRPWWTAFRRCLEQTFRQESVLIHAGPIEIL